MITEWAQVIEPPIQRDFVLPAYVTDIQILTSGKGIVMVTPDGTMLARMFIDLDGAVATEVVGPYSGVVPATSPPFEPFPVFGQALGDLMILSPGAGVLFPTSRLVNPRLFYRLSVDDIELDINGQQVAPIITDVATVNGWWKVDEKNIAAGLDVNNNWIFSQDVLIATPGQGIVMPQRGLSTTLRLRVDDDGAPLTE